METCPKYNRAMGVSFTSKDEVEELIQWLLDTTTDPISGSLYPDAYTPSIWIPYRLEVFHFKSSLNNMVFTPVISKLKDSLQTYSMRRKWILAPTQALILLTLQETVPSWSPCGKDGGTGSAKFPQHMSFLVLVSTQGRCTSN